MDYFLDHCQEWSPITTDQRFPWHQNYLCSEHTPPPALCLQLLQLPDSPRPGHTPLQDSVALHWLILEELTVAIRWDTMSREWQECWPIPAIESAQRTPEEVRTEGLSLEEGHYSPH